MRLKRAILAAASILAIAASTPASAEGVSIDDILNDQSTAGDIVTNGQDIRGQRFSPLDKINTSNVAGLAPAWVFSFGGENSPLEVRHQERYS